MIYLDEVKSVDVKATTLATFTQHTISETNSDSFSYYN